MIRHIAAAYRARRSARAAERDATARSTPAFWAPAWRAGSDTGTIPADATVVSADLRLSVDELMDEHKRRRNQDYLNRRRPDQLASATVRIIPRLVVRMLEVDRGAGSPQQLDPSSGSAELDAGSSTVTSRLDDLVPDFFESGVVDSREPVPAEMNVPGHENSPSVRDGEAATSPSVDPTLGDTADTSASSPSGSREDGGRGAATSSEPAAPHFTKGDGR